MGRRVWEVPWGASSQGNALTARCAHRDTLLTLVVTEVDVGLPLALQMPLLGGDALRTAEDRVAAEVLVALLNKPIKHSPFNGSRNNG